MNVLITGVSSGLGKELAVQFLSKGDIVWGLSRKEKHSKELQPLFAYENFNYRLCDISKEEEVSLLFRMEAFIPDVVVLNAGNMDDDLKKGKFDYTQFRKVFTVNLFGAVTFMDKLMPIFQQRGKGVFVGISSLSAYRALVMNKVAYPSSKAALSMAFQAFRVQFAESNLRFLTFHLGPMGEKQRLFQTSYQKAAHKVVRHLYSGKQSDVVNFPKAAVLMTKISLFFRDAFLLRMLSRHQKRFKPEKSD